MCGGLCGFIYVDEKCTPNVLQQCGVVVPNVAFICSVGDTKCWSNRKVESSVKCVNADAMFCGNSTLLATSPRCHRPYVDIIILDLHSQPFPLSSDAPRSDVTDSMRLSRLLCQLLRLVAIEGQCQGSRWAEVCLILGSKNGGLCCFCIVQT